MERNGFFTTKDPNTPNFADHVLALHIAPRGEPEMPVGALAVLERDLERAQRDEAYDQIMAHVVLEYRDMTAAREKRRRA